CYNGNCDFSLRAPDETRSEARAHAACIRARPGWGFVRCSRQYMHMLTLQRDIKAIFEKDPAARSIWEVLSYPGLHAIFWHRVAHAMWNVHLKTPARWLSNLART